MSLPVLTGACVCCPGQW